MQTQFGSQGAHEERGNPLSASRSRRTGEPGGGGLPRGHACLFRLTVRCALDDVDAVDALVQEALGENLQTQKRQRLSRASGTHFCRLEVIVSCEGSARRSVMALMSGLEREALVHGVVWETVAYPGGD